MTTLDIDYLLKPDPFHDEMVQELWKDVNASKNSFPHQRPLLAHYTSITTFEQIISNKEMWLSNPLYMNDLEELRFGMNEGATEFRANKEILDACGDATKYKRLISHFDVFFNLFSSEDSFNTYVLCFTEHTREDNDGMLSMWRGYGVNGKGIAIVFDTSKIKPLSDSPLILSKVEYKSTIERKKWINDSLSILAKFIKRAPSIICPYNNSDFSDYLMLIAYNWLERLISFAIFTKHHGFHEEKEWRVVYLSRRDKDDAFKNMLGYVISQHGIEPKLKLKINSLPDFPKDGLSFEKIIDRVILGPSISTALAAKSVSRMLKMNGIPQLADKIKTSSIPYRPL